MDCILFIETIEAIQKQNEHDINCNDAFKVVFPDIFVAFYDNHHLTNQLIKLLQVAMADNHAHSWIEYYLFELEFGKKYRPGCATRPDKTNIDLSTPSKLYDFLMEQK